MDVGDPVLVTSSSPLLNNPNMEINNWNDIEYNNYNKEL